MKHFLVTILVITICYNSTIMAQSSDSTTGVHFTVSANYASSLHYYGRQDSMQSSGFFPMVAVWFTPTLYINAAPVFVHNNNQPFAYAGTVASVGALFNSRDKWITHLYFLKPVYKDQAALVQSALKSQTGASISFLSKIVNVSAEADVKFSDHTDFGVTGNIGHTIRFPVREKSSWVIDPTANVYLGTQQFTTTYYQKKKGFLLMPGTEEQVNQSASRFSILAYELSIPVYYTRGKVQFTVSPSFISPQNLVIVPGRPDLSENGKNMLNLTVGAKLSL